MVGVWIVARPEELVLAYVLPGEDRVGAVEEVADPARLGLEQGRAEREMRDGDQRIRRFENVAVAVDHECLGRHRVLRRRDYVALDLRSMRSKDSRR